MSTIKFCRPEDSHRLITEIDSEATVEVKGEDGEVTTVNLADQYRAEGFVDAESLPPLEPIVNGAAADEAKKPAK